MVLGDFDVMAHSLFNSSAPKDANVYFVGPDMDTYRDDIKLVAESCSSEGGFVGHGWSREKHNPLTVQEVPQTVSPFDAVKILMPLQLNLRLA